MKYLLGLDNGGTFCKAALFDENGKQIAVASYPTLTFSPKPGYMERNMEEMWDMSARAIRGAVEKSGVDPIDIIGVSFSGHGKGLYLIGFDGKPSYKGIPSTDARAWEYPKKWNSDGTAAKVFEKTYQKILSCQPVSILAWLRDNEPEVLSNTKNIFMINDYLRYCLTGEAYAEYSTSSGGNLVNLATGKYDKELLGLFGLEEIWDKLPPLRNSMDVCGYVTEEAAQQTGLAVGTPVAAGMFDVNACGVATGLVDEEAMCMIAGTWSINEFIARKPVLNGTVDLNSMYCIPGYFLVEESSPTSAGNLEWFIQQLMSYEKQEMSLQGRPVYEMANSMVESVEPQDSNVVFLPFLNGSNEDPLAKGSWIGLTAFHEKKHMLRAVYEGIVFSHVTHVKKLLINKDKPEAIRLSGGAVNSQVWVQMFADVLQVPIDIVEGVEIGAQGAAMSAGIAAGLFKDYPEAGDRMVKIGRRVMPRPEYKDIYEEKYQTYRVVIDGLSSAWERFQN